MNEPVIIIQAELFTSNYTNRLGHVFTALLLKYRLHINVKTYLIFGHVLTGNSHCHGICYIKKSVPLCSIRLNRFKMFLTSGSKVLNLVFSNN